MSKAIEAVNRMNEINAEIKTLFEERKRLSDVVMQTENSEYVGKRYYGEISEEMCHLMIVFGSTGPRLDVLSISAVYGQGIEVSRELVWGNPVKALSSVFDNVVELNDEEFVNVVDTLLDEFDGLMELTIDERNMIVSRIAEE